MRVTALIENHLVVPAEQLHSERNI